MLKIIKIVTLFFGVIAAQAQSITATGAWSHTFPTVTEAGSNLSTTAATSSTNQTIISFSGFTPSSTYTVRVHKSDVAWNASLVLYIDRTSNGTGASGSSISGGTTSFALTGTPQVYFSGSVGTGTGFTGINNQYRITGQTVLIPAKTYTTNVVYTISN